MRRNLRNRMRHCGHDICLHSIAVTVASFNEPLRKSLNHINQNLLQFQRSELNLDAIASKLIDNKLGFYRRIQSFDAIHLYGGFYNFTALGPLWYIFINTEV